jgi:hypothetical protein
VRGSTYVGDGSVTDDADRTGDDLEPRDVSANGGEAETTGDGADGVSVRRAVRFGAIAVAVVSLLLVFGT